MLKKSLYVLLGVLLIGFVVAGCGKTDSALTATVTDVTTVGSSKATLSGALSYSSGGAEINLNAIIISGDAVTLGASRFMIRVGKDSTTITSAPSVEITLPPASSRPMDMVFIMDNTGSMSSRIIAVKNSIASFAASIEAAGINVKFGVVSFGDDPSETSTLNLPASASQVSTWLSTVEGVSGGDTPENPVDAVMNAYNGFSWRSGAQKIFVVITDNPCHQGGDGTTFTSRNVSSVEASLFGKATVYAVSPKIDSGVSGPWGYSGTGDIRWLSDGYGWFDGVTAASYEAVKPHLGTGGKWIELPGSGDIDLNALNISATVTKGYTVKFDYTFDSGVWYIYLLVDTNEDGIFDSNMLIKLNLASSSAAGIVTVPFGEGIKATAFGRDLPYSTVRSFGLKLQKGLTGPTRN